MKKCLVSHSRLLSTIWSPADIHKPHAGGFVTGAEVLQQRKACFKISTGSKQWDSILNGGFESKSINEVYGEYRCGKTQLAHTLCVMAQLPKDQGGGEGRVAYIGMTPSGCVAS